MASLPAASGWSKRFHRWWPALVASLGFLGLSLFTSRILPGPWSHQAIGRGYDPYLFMWFLGWWPHALAHGTSPMSTPILWAPSGINLAWTTSVPGLALPFLPVTRAVGVVTAYNLAMIAGLTLSAVAAFLLVRALSGSALAGLLGGYVYAFSPFLMGQFDGGHLNWVWAAMPPTIALAALKRWRGDWSASLTILMVTWAVAAQFLWSSELFATTWVMAIAAIVISWPFQKSAGRENWWRTVSALAAGGVLGTFLVSPLIVYMILHPGSPSGLSPARFAITPLNLVVPTRLTIGGSLFTGISRLFPGQLVEQGGYVGLPALAWLLSGRKWQRRQPIRRTLAIFFWVAAVFAMGPGLPLKHFTVPLPWVVATHLPLLRHALPDRLMIFAFLALALLLGLFIADHAISAVYRGAVAMLVGISLWPSPAMHPTVAFNPPSLFSSRHAIQSLLPPHPRLLIFPFTYQGAAMAYQALSHYRFQMSAGVVGANPPVPYSSWPFVRMAGAGALPNCSPVWQALSTYLAVTRVNAIVAVGNSRPQVAQWARHFGWTHHVTPNATIYAVPPSTASSIPTPSAAASRSAFSAYTLLWEAIRQYLRQGHSVASLSLSALAKSHDYPGCLVLGPTVPVTAEQTWAVPMSGNRVAVGIIGTWPVLRPVVTRFGPLAGQVDFPTMLKPVANPPNLHSLGTLLMIFPRQAFTSTP
ncbi:MAG: hypothetical protein M0Z53_07565 [Thermaerobacter sp.]|nr:hypothetical protein [Thermaerobacter sp.]